MKTNELRIGNLYDNNGNYFVVTPSTIESVFESERVWCKPIKLTEEWLVKFGFKRIDHTYSMNDGSMNYRYELNGNDPHWCLYFNNRNFAFNESKLNYIHLFHNKYVHQLQNLYFALTGEELNIKMDY